MIGEIEPDIKVIIDILYGVDYSTATCIAVNSTAFHCIVNEENQSKTTLIKICRGTKSSVSWKYLQGEKSIGLLTDLTFEKAVNSDIYVDKTELIRYLNSIINTKVANDEEKILSEKALEIYETFFIYF